jgi:glutathione-regulated potassium-efflux system ancillary protein KefG
MSGKTSNQVLILFAHPALEKSRVNRRLIAVVRDLDGVTFHDLYEAYPDFYIDVKHEQTLLDSHDVIIFQHPLYWYSTPALLKEWQDLVLEHGWAYGHDGAALRDKKLLTVTTTGGREDAYQEKGHNRFTMRQLLAPIEQAAYLCGMDYLPPFVVHGTHEITDRGMQQHAQDYGRAVMALRDGMVDFEAASSFPRLNSDLDAIIKAAPEGM